MREVCGLDTLEEDGNPLPSSDTGGTDTVLLPVPAELVDHVGGYPENIIDLIANYRL